MPNLSTPQASAYLLERHGIRRHAQSLRNMRLYGGGPAYLRDLGTGAVLYPTENLDAWAAELLRPAGSTAGEPGIARQGRLPVEARAGIGTPAVLPDPRRRRRQRPAA